MPEMPPESNRDEYPIRHSLPGDQGAYTDNLAVHYFLAPWEGHTNLLRSELNDYVKNYINPDTARPENLDWLAQLAGYTGVYWDSSWPVAAKRSLIREAYSRVWPMHGTTDLIDWLLTQFEIGHTLLTGAVPARADVDRADQATVGDLSAIFHVLIADKHSRAVWPTVQRLTNLFIPLWVAYTISYENARADVARAGEIVTS